VGDWCSVRIRVDGTEMNPQSGSDFAFDTVTTSSGPYVGASMQRSLVVGPGTHFVNVDERIVGSGVTFRLDDWQLTTTESKNGA